MITGNAPGRRIPEIDRGGAAFKQTMGPASFSEPTMNHQSTTAYFRPFPAHPQRSHAPALAATLDRLADAELQHGHHAAAEHLARQAAAMREAAR